MLKPEIFSQLLTFLEERAFDEIEGHLNLIMAASGLYPNSSYFFGAGWGLVKTHLSPSVKAGLY